MPTTWKEVSNIAQEFPETEVHDHIGNPAVRVKGKIFIQQSADDIESIVIKLSKERQSSLISEDGKTYKAPPHWGKFGWTIINLSKVKKTDIAGLVLESWLIVAPKSVSKSYAKMHNNPKQPTVNLPRKTGHLLSTAKR